MSGDRIPSEGYEEDELGTRVRIGNTKVLVNSMVDPSMQVTEIGFSSEDSGEENDIFSGWSGLMAIAESCDEGFAFDASVDSTSWW